jgi:hypothetical protein
VAIVIAISLMPPAIAWLRSRRAKAVGSPTLPS